MKAVCLCIFFSYMHLVDTKLQHLFEQQDKIQIANFIVETIIQNDYFD